MDRDAHRSASAAPLRVVLLGDSLAAGTGDETGKGIAGHLRNAGSPGERPLAVTMLAMRGATTADLMARLRQRQHREAVAAADVIVLSIGANDLFRDRTLLGGPPTRLELLRAPRRIADEILRRIERIVGELRALAPQARLLVLGGYNPAPRHALSGLLEPLVGMWDARLVRRFAAEPRLQVVPIRDVVDRPERLSRLDGFHPGAEAYREMARRVAGMIGDRSRAA